MVMRSGQAKGGRSDARLNRERILTAACVVFAQQGLDGEIREVAERAGLAVGTIYRHFENREALLSALLLETKRDLLDRLASAAQNEEPETALRAGIRSFALVCERFGSLTEALFAGRLEHLHGGHAEFTEMLAKILKRGIDEGGFRADLDVPAAVSMLEGAFMSGAFLRLARERSFHLAADSIAEIFLRACRKGDKEPTR
ncbi:MAG: TetR family transcriptional regulator [Dehalococcoidia bacterium]|nr:TetR family transcriptional regulator [Dehalococcoidia bacterium]